MHSASPGHDLPLRRVALHVEEVRAGRYQWVLSEVDDTAGARWTPIDRAAQPASTYREAVAQGLLALQGMVDDLDTGPRQAQAAADDEIEQDPEADHQAPKGDRTPAPEKSEGPHTAFGFGLVK